MSEVSASMIKDLRERTGAGMSDCKKALTEVGGDMEKAIDYLRRKGRAIMPISPRRAETTRAPASRTVTPSEKRLSRSLEDYFRARADAAHGGSDERRAFYEARVDAAAHEVDAAVVVCATEIAARHPGVAPCDSNYVTILDAPVLVHLDGQRDSTRFLLRDAQWALNQAITDSMLLPLDLTVRR